jgi:AcrR family transcriptional regulator
MSTAELHNLRLGSGGEPGTTERRLRNKRAIIMSAGLKLFAHHPYQAVTMEQVAASAGVSRGTLYLYFPSKETLYLAILANGLDETFSAYNLTVRSKDDILDRLRGAIMVALRYYDTQRDLLRLLVAYEPQLAEQRRSLIKAARERMVEFFTALIEEGVARGVFRPVNARLAALSIQGRLVRFRFSTSFRTPDPTSPRSFAT